MQIFNVGILEVLFILIIAFIVLGPKKTIDAARNTGRWFRNLGKSPLWQEIITTSNEIRDIPKRIMDDVELQKTIEDLEISTQEINQTLSQIQQEAQSDLSKLSEEINQNIEIDFDPEKKE